MTKGETRLILQENFGLLSFEYPGRISEAIKIAIEVLSQLSLPSDFDEAAEEWVRPIIMGTPSKASVGLILGRTRNEKALY